MAKNELTCADSIVQGAIATSHISNVHLLFNFINTVDSDHFYVHVDHLCTNSHSPCAFIYSVFVSFSSFCFFFLFFGSFMTLIVD